MLRMARGKSFSVQFSAFEHHVWLVHVLEDA